MIVDIIDPKPHENRNHPGMRVRRLSGCRAEHVWTNLEKEAVRRKWDVERFGKRRSTPHKILSWIDKDAFLARLTKAYMALIGDAARHFLRR